MRRCKRSSLALGLILLFQAIPVYAAVHSTALGESSSYELRLDTDKPVLKVFHRGQLIRSYPVALGADGSETPIGHWHIVDKQKDWGGGFGTRWLGLDVPWGTYGIHGTNKPYSIGKFASHGCIRMHNRDVEQLYELIPFGTSVVIHGNPLRHLRVLTEGNVGADVQLVQTRLKAKGYLRGPCHGRFTPSMQYSLLLFELAHRLPMDGVVGIDDYHVLGLTRDGRTLRRCARM